MTTKEQVLAAARTRFATKEVPIDDTVKVTVRELSRPQRDALNARLFVCGADGKPITVNEQGDPDPKGTEWKLVDGAKPIEEWLAVAMEPQFTVEELSGPEWPTSLKRKLYEEAMSVNGVTLADAAGN